MIFICKECGEEAIWGVRFLAKELRFIKFVLLTSIRQKRQGW